MNDILSREKLLIGTEPDDFKGFLVEHTTNANYLVTRDPKNQIPKGKDQRFRTNESVWSAVINRKTSRPDANIILENFFLYEWFPRSPGLYHTPHAARARELGMLSVDSDDAGVLKPEGKLSMLKGGLGCIRLRPIEIEREPHYLMTASATSDCHEGFPLAVPESIYSQHIEEIIEFGAKSCSIVGNVRFVPDSLAKIYKSYTGVPQVYLRVKDIRTSEETDNTPAAPPGTVWDPSVGTPRTIEEYKVSEQKRFWVSVAVSFSSQYEGPEQTYATYVSFPPGVGGALTEAVDWIQDYYVRGKYNGKVITDFDQQQSNFEDAPFSLEKVMKLKLSEAEIGSFGFGRQNLISVQAEVINLVGGNQTYMAGDVYNNSGNVGAMGANAQASNFSQALEGTMPADLLGQLEFLRKALKEEAQKQEAAGENTDNYDEAIGVVTQAKKAAEAGDESKAKGFLKSAGSWLLDFGTKIGVSLVTEVIKQQTGLK